jgi:Trypsin-like peptidase domain
LLQLSNSLAKRRCLFWLVPCLLLCAFGVSDRVVAQGNAQQIQGLIKKSQRAIAKVIVDGSTPSGGDKHEEGSGFFVYSSHGVSFLITALHVVGSSETEQSKNSQWQVENGSVVRSIEIKSLDEHANLKSLGKDVYVVPTALPGVDLALLMMRQDGYPTLPLAGSLIDKVDLHDVLLLGYAAGQSSLTIPTPVGTGQLRDATTYLTSIPSHRGESGGPWIDVQSGRVFAVARLVNTAANSPSYESTPVTLIKPSLVEYFQTLGTDLNQGSDASLSVLERSGTATIWISGDSGELLNLQKSTGGIGKSVSMKGQGGEVSQCDSGSGRTISQVDAQALISTFNVNGLRFEYSAAAQGGHYTTAVSCLDTLPVGLRGHDTRVHANVELKGMLDFTVGGTAVSLDWNGMPQSGASFVLMQEGQTMIQQPINAGGHQILQLRDGAKYRLMATISIDLQSPGSCCGQTQSANATIALAPASVGLSQQ